jgi:hypothetical protein
MDHSGCHVSSTAYVFCLQNYVVNSGYVDHTGCRVLSTVNVFCLQSNNVVNSGMQRTLRAG